jgi:hypothetical protein
MAASAVAIFFCPYIISMGFMTSSSTVRSQAEKMRKKETGKKKMKKQFFNRFMTEPFGKFKVHTGNEYL